MNAPSAPATPSLVYQRASGKTAIYALPNGTTTIGRAPDNDVMLDDASVADHHAIVTREGEKLALRDLLSKGRTFVNDKPARESEVKPNDVLRFGEVRVRVAYVATTSTGRFVRVDEAEPLRPITSHGGIALPKKTNSKAIARTRQLSDEIGVEPDPEAILQKVASALIEIFDSDRAVCLLFEEDGHNPLLTVERRKAGSEEGAGVSREIIDRCLKARAVVKIAAPATGRPGEGKTEARGFAAPLMSKGKALGLIFHERASDAPPLDGDDAHLTAIITNNVALAVTVVLSEG